MHFNPSGPVEHDGVFGLPHGAEDARVVLIPVPWDPTTSYRKGTARGPQAIRSASRQVDLFDRETGKPYEAGIHMLDENPDVVRWNATASAAAAPIIDAGGPSAALAAELAHVNDMSRTLNAFVERTTDHWLARGKIVGVVGGDHSVPYGSIAAYAGRYPKLGVLHIDAHADLRDAYEGFDHSHASIMFNVLEHLPIARLVQVGIRDLSEEEHTIMRSDTRVHAFFDDDVHRRVFEGETFGSIAREIAAALPEDVYVSFDIDGLDPAHCPHTGTPVPGGLSFRQACYLLAAVVGAGKRIVGFDLNEVAPGPEGDEWDGNVGARLLYKLCGWAIRSLPSAPG